MSGGAAGRRRIRSIRPAERSVASDVGKALPRVLKLVGTVIAPATLLTALLFYFGRLHATGMFRYLGIDLSVVDLSVQDYLIRSQDGLFFPLTAAAGIALIIIWARALALRYVKDQHRRLVARRAAPVFVLVGLGAIGVAARALVGAPAIVDYPEIPGLCLAVGAICVVVGIRTLTPGPHRDATAIVEWGAVFFLVSVGLFWAVGSYAIEVGTGRAAQIEGGLAKTPDLVLRSQHPLGIDFDGAEEIACGDPESPSGYRYSGLKLILQSGGNYFVLPANWTHQSGGAVAIPRTDEIQLEFLTPGTPLPPTC